MTTFINELADLIPSCHQQKPDKLSILRLAATHCKVNHHHLKIRVGNALFMDRVFLVRRFLCSKMF